MNETELTKQLAKEGFRHTYVWQDAPGVYYPEHIHETETAHVILQGENDLDSSRANANLANRRAL